MNGSGTQLHVVMYHYVRDLPNTRFPAIKGMLTRDFEAQVESLAGRYEMATLESALDFLAGSYLPRRDLCLLTFDDGFKDHYTDVLPILAQRGIQGLFFVVTSCVEEHKVLPVHKNHFLMAALGFEEYRDGVLKCLAELSADTSTDVDMATAQRTYRWDTPEVAALKYLLNFRLEEDLRDRLLDMLFAQHLGDEAEFSHQLYLSWEEAREMQSAGQLIGGHTHTHVPLARLDDERQRADLEKCACILRERVSPQTLWPFSYPYGKSDTFNTVSIQALRDLDFACSFSTEVGPNAPNTDPYAIRRFDPKDVKRDA